MTLMLSPLKSQFKGCLIGTYLGLKLVTNEDEMENIFHLIFTLGDFILDNNNSTRNINTLRKKISQIEQELPLILLPIILLYHDKFSKLEEELEFILDGIEANEIVKQNIIIWSKAIALICQSQSTPENLINQIIITQKNTSEELKIIHQYYQKRKSLYDLFQELNKQKSLEQSTIALALYYFISTPKNCNLSLKRAKIGSNYHNSTVVGLTGTLSGLYNGHDNLVNPWQFTDKDHKIIKAIKILAEKLFLQWCGVYQIKENETLNLINVSNINLIQPRNWPQEYD